MKLATVGAVGIDSNPNKNSVHVMDPNAVMWGQPNHLTQQPLILTEGEIIQRII